MISVAIDNPSYGTLKIKDSKGYVVYTNHHFRYIDHLESLDPDLYLIHLKIENKNYYEILQLQEIDATLEVRIGCEGVKILPK